MENNSSTPNLDKAEERRTALIEKHKGFLEKAVLQGMNPDTLLALLDLADLAISKLGKILKGKRIC